MADTTMRLNEEVADRLFALKGRNESYNDVVERLLDETTIVVEIDADEIVTSADAKHAN